MATLFGTFPFLQKLFADGGYQGPEFNRALARMLLHLKAAIVKRSDRAKGFVVLPKRRVVERTFAWLIRCRRLVKDRENLNRKALAFMRLASICLMLRRLRNSVLKSPDKHLIKEIWYESLGGFLHGGAGPRGARNSRGRPGASGAAFHEAIDQYRGIHGSRRRARNSVDSKPRFLEQTVEHAPGKCAMRAAAL